MAPGRKSIVHQHSGWLIPLGLGLAILALSGLFLLWDLRPSLRAGLPSADTAPLDVSVRGLRLSVPANYIEPSPARGGQDTLALIPRFPAMNGYTLD